MSEQEQPTNTGMHFTVGDMYSAFKHGMEFEKIDSDSDLPNDIPDKNLPFYDWLHKKYGV